MAVKLRLRRMGSHKRPFYRIVAADSRYQRDGRFLEVIGHYDPMAKPFQYTIDREKAIAWLNKGAQMSETVENLMRKDGIIQDLNRAKFSKNAEKSAQTAQTASE